jgi:hypothetical protein
VTTVIGSLTSRFWPSIVLVRPSRQTAGVARLTKPLSQCPARSRPPSSCQGWCISPGLRHGFLHSHLPVLGPGAAIQANGNSCTLLSLPVLAGRGVTRFHSRRHVSVSRDDAYGRMLLKACELLLGARGALLLLGLHPCLPESELRASSRSPSAEQRRI